MKIKVTKTTKAASCPLGIMSKDYIEGQTYDIFNDLAEMFISEGWGKKFDDASIKEKTNSIKIEKPKSFKLKLDNKAIQEVGEDKKIEGKTKVNINNHKKKGKR